MRPADCPCNLVADGVTFHKAISRRSVPASAEPPPTRSWSEPGRIMEYDFDLGGHGRPVSASASGAQIWVDRGLNWLYGFHPEEAARCFRRAAAADPGCAMAQWGDAYASGPFYNLPWEWMTAAEQAETLAICHAALCRAEAASAAATPVEQALIAALRARYPRPEPGSPAEMAAWTRAYAEAMRGVAHAFPEDLDVIALTAEALMMTAPWDLWDLHSGTPKPGAPTREVIALLERGIARAGDRPHLAINHLYIHAVEMGPLPEQALRQADELAGLAPDLGHMEHMGAHIFTLCGAYDRAIEASRRAVLADAKAIAHGGRRQFYTTSCCHNLHMLMFAAMMSGRSGPALWAAERMRALVTPEVLDTPRAHMVATLEGYHAKKLHAFIRFGQWRAVIADPPSPDAELYCVTEAMRAYARAIAFAALGAIAEAEAERRAFERARAAIPSERFHFNNAADAILSVGEAMLEGELLYRKGRYESAFAALRTAVARADALHYSEPWPWMHPPRHALGALLLEQGRLAEAEAVYRQDLGYDASVPRCRRHPDNVWALHGLSECLSRRHAPAPETMMVGQRLSFAQARTDTPVLASCACRGGPEPQPRAPH